VRQGLLNPVEDISVGIETMPAALADLYLGNNVGVRMVQVGEPALPLDATAATEQD
jgi:NADPH-dependent curcumin reductase CurA